MSSDRAENGTAYNDEGEESAVRRLLVLILSEALKAGRSETQIGPGETAFPVQFVRQDEVLVRDSLPKRVFRLLRDHIAAKCGKLDSKGHGSFEASIPQIGRDLEVSVVVGNSEFRLRTHPGTQLAST